ncbi:Crp/Fnr family transcriptional regulator [Aureivirga marina]|uniref:Crp/Fnr family transcriptional regulator n=1 Tax=Aureivirga marina TaxID=1182451 RepID=UPI0018CA6EC8|nr:Crp/Fnr family transcriptional regulator [Aureivirga marina]
MTHSFIQNIQKHVSLSIEEISYIESFLKLKKLKKKEFLLQGKEICTNLSYIDKGCLKIFTIGENGEEHIIFFAIEDWWALDLKSFITKEPARFFIEAMEDSEISQISNDNFQLLLDKIPKLEKWFRILLQNALIASENRIDHKLSLNAEQRYFEFSKKYPSLETRISQRQIASYLGITPEFLSKLRAQKWKSKKP